MTCPFIVLLLQALIGLEIRREMARRDIEALALSPEHPPAVVPSSAHMIEAFTGVARHRLFDAEGNLVQAFATARAPLQEELLDLLGVSLAPTPNVSAGGRKTGPISAERGIGQPPSREPRTRSSQPRTPTS